MGGRRERRRLLEVVTKILRSSGHHRPEPLLEDSGRIHVQLFQSPAQVVCPLVVGGIDVIRSTVGCKGPGLNCRSGLHFVVERGYSRRTKTALRMMRDRYHRRVVILIRAVAHSEAAARSEVRWDHYLEEVCCNGVALAPSGWCKCQS